MAFNDIISGMRNYIPPTQPAPAPLPFIAPPPYVAPQQTFTAPPAYYNNLESQKYVNPYYVGPKPEGAGYERFDTTQKGSGVQNLPNPAVAFDNIVASRFTNPIPVDPNPRLGGYAQGGFNSFITDELRRQNPITPEEQAVIDYNRELDLNKQRYRNYFESNPDAIGNLAGRGVDLNSIKSLADLDAIPYQLKGDAFGSYVDDFERAKQFENQREPQGIADSLGGFGGLLAPAFGALVGGPLGGALFGGLVGGLDQGPFGALTGAASGYGFGNLLTNGITNPFTGTNYTGPIAYGGSGVPFPTGAYTPGGRDVLDVGGIGNPYQFPNLPGVPQIPGGTQDPQIPNPWLPPLLTIPPLIPSGTPPPGSEGPRDTTPPFIPIPPITSGSPPASPTGSPSLAADSSNPLMGLLGRGGGEPFSPFETAAIPGPPQRSAYFGYGVDPFGASYGFNRNIG